MTEYLCANGKRVLAGCVALSLFVGATGCGSKGTVTGKISYRDKPVPGGTIFFLTEGKGTFESKIQPDGKYTVENVPAGTVKIYLETESIRPAPRPKMPKPPKDQVPPGAEDNPVYGAPAANRYVKIPDKYTSPEKSGLTLDVRGGNQDYDIPLKD
jgi:hypothetical protein